MFSKIYIIQTPLFKNKYISHNKSVKGSPARDLSWWHIWSHQNATYHFKPHLKHVLIYLATSIWQRLFFIPNLNALKLTLGDVGDSWHTHYINRRCIPITSPYAKMHFYRRLWVRQSACVFTFNPLLHTKQFHRYNIYLRDNFIQFY